MNAWRTIALSALLASAVGIVAGCAGAPRKQVVIYSNADEEAVVAMQKALDGAGLKGQYVFQSYGTGELGGKLLAEGSGIEADVVTMSSYFIESAQAKNDMFATLTNTPKPIDAVPDYSAPILGLTGSLFVNTELVKQKGLPLPKSLKDLTNPIYKNLVSIPNIESSSTAWLMVQAILSQYGEDEGIKVFRGLIENCGPHLEKSGSGPIKKVRAGEVAVGFGLRHQAVADHAAGKPVDCIDPTEGNFSITEAVAVVKKGKADVSLAQKVAGVIVSAARKDLIAIYPVALYPGETVDPANVPAYPKKFGAPLTTDLLSAHIQLFNKAMQ
jgi:ABC-type Fe3+ transport system substrate-binding protein